jgi:nucleoid-associated protein YgaU
MRTKTISRLRRAALAAAAAAALVWPSRAEELEGPSRLAAPPPAPAPAPAAAPDSAGAANPAAAPNELEGPSRVGAPPAVEGPARAEAPAKPKRRRKGKGPAKTDAAPAMAPSPSEPAQQDEAVAHGETRPQRMLQPEPPLTSEGPEGRLVMPKSAEEKGMQIQPDTPEIYVIVKGDTLWDLSQKFLNNPWYWPKIWSLNAYIENPHWIYPGNKLKLIPGQGPQAPTQVEPEPTNDERPQSEIANQVDTSPPEAADLAVVRKGSREFEQSGNSVSVSGKLAFKPPPVLTIHDSGLVTPEEMREAGSLDASFEEKDMLSTFDTAYVRFPRGAEVNVGDRIILFRPEGDIVQPVTGRRLGTQTRSMGEAQVISFDGRLATVQITRTWEEIERGDLARPWTEQDVRVAPKPNTKEMRGVIVSAVRRGLTTLGESNEVFIDKGERDGVEVGNTFAVVRKGDGLHDAAVYGQAYNMGATGSRATGVAVPYESVGLLLVVDVKDRLSTAVVVRSVKELRKGDVVEMRPQGSGGP